VSRDNKADCELWSKRNNMDTTEKIKFMRDFLSAYEQDRGNFLPDESLSPFTEKQLENLRMGFEECTDFVLYYQDKLERDKITKKICQWLFNRAIEDGAPIQHTAQQVLKMESLIYEHLKGGYSTEKAWALAHDEYQKKIKSLLHRKFE
jgi:hypothetical protein